VLPLPPQQPVANREEKIDGADWAATNIRVPRTLGKCGLWGGKVRVVSWEGRGGREVPEHERLWVPECATVLHREHCVTCPLLCVSRMSIWSANLVEFASFCEYGLNGLAFVDQGLMCVGWTRLHHSACRSRNSAFQHPFHIPKPPTRSGCVVLFISLCVGTPTATQCVTIDSPE
jgi:hypothetical protein